MSVEQKAVITSYVNKQPEEFRPYALAYFNDLVQQIGETPNGKLINVRVNAVISDKYDFINEYYGEDSVGQIIENFTIDFYKTKEQKKLINKHKKESTNLFMKQQNELKEYCIDYSIGC